MRAMYLTIGIMCVALSNNSYSQEMKNKVETELPCYDTNEIFASLKENFKEFPILTGRAGDFANSSVSIWMNPIDNTWTIIATKKDITYLIGSGTDMKIVPHKKGSNI